MALIKCSECNKEVSTLAKTCPHCGAPVNLEPEEEKELVKISILKDKCKLITIILNFLISFGMFIAFVVIDIDSYFLVEFRNQQYELVNCLTEGILLKEVLIFYGLVGLITFISYLLTIISKQTVIIAKIGYIINIILQQVFFYIAYANDYRVGIQYYVIFALNILLFLIPRFDKLASEENLLPENRKEQIEKNNKKLEKIYSKKRFTKTKVISVIVILVLTIISTAIVYIKNLDEVKAYKQRNPKDLDQIKVTEDWIRVREEPSFNGEVIGKIYEDDIYNIIEIIEDKNKDFIWYEIRYNDETAYVASNIKDPYVKIIYNDEDENDYNYENDYEYEDHSNNSSTSAKRKLIKELERNSYTETGDGEYTQYYNSDGTTIITTISLNEKKITRYGEVDGYQSGVDYYYEEGKAEFIFIYEDLYGEFIYSFNSNRLTGCDSNASSYCSDNAYDNLESLVIPLKEHFDDLLDSANIDVDDL